MYISQQLYIYIYVYIHIYVDDMYSPSAACGQSVLRGHLRPTT